MVLTGLEFYCLYYAIYNDHCILYYCYILLYTDLNWTEPSRTKLNEVNSFEATISDLFQGDGNKLRDTIYECTDRSYGCHILIRPFISVSADSCGHPVCEKMIELARLRNIRSFKCPSKTCSKILVTDEMRLNKAMDKELLKQKVKCWNSRNCRWVVT